jgi:hypothetical protein
MPRIVKTKLSGTLHNWEIIKYYGEKSMIKYILPQRTKNL